MTQTDDLYAFANYTYTLLNANKVSLGLQGMFYGDQSLIPVSPIACVEPDTQNVVLKGAFRQVENEFRVYVLVYTAFVQSPDANRRAADQLSQSIKTLLNSDAQCGGLVAHSMVEEIASGYATKTGAIHRANRILFTGKSTSRLPGS